eukprot:CAMPEP_0168318824 /NCGR_PEP_ID=MMETSP0213-20121227/701_1 /TAXON_ID=151035 /ORGANISM="Euplotes harpa, Strain FSP1.4" /LENGTH=112 /DNA_ID=CAMNT_0008319949 /DNA_START=163 /DNA_END=501 /DNA_ORIENTATION=-
MGNIKFHWIKKQVFSKTCRVPIINILQEEKFTEHVDSEILNIDLCLPTLLLKDDIHMMLQRLVKAKRPNSKLSDACSKLKKNKFDFLPISEQNSASEFVTMDQIEKAKLRSC